MIRVLVVHEHRLIGDMITAVLRKEGRFEVSRSVHKVDCVVEHLEQMLADVVLVSMTLPNSSALPLVHRICERFLDCKVVVTNLIRSKTAILQCLEEGAAGYVLEDESLSALTHRIHDIYHETFKISPDVASAMVSRLAELKRLATTLGSAQSGAQTLRIENSYNELTPREQEVLGLLAKGQTNHEISEELVIEVGTVKNHVHNIFRKLDIHERQHAAVIAQHIL